MKANEHRDAAIIFCKFWVLSHNKRLIPLWYRWAIIFFIQALASLTPGANMMCILMELHFAKIHQPAKEE